MTTSIKSEQIRDGEVKRADLNTTETGSAVIAKIVDGIGIELTSTGVDAGTGDVTVKLGDGNNLKWDDTNKRIGLGVASPNEILTLNGAISLQEQSSAPSATSGFGKLYTKQDTQLYYKDSTGVETQICVTRQRYVATSFIASCENKTYNIGQNIPFAGTIKSITTKAASGTCTVTGKINGTSLGGTANSASSSETNQVHSSANTFIVSDDLTFVISSNSSCVDLAITIEYERDVVFINPSTGALKFSMTMFVPTVENKTIVQIQNSAFAGTIKKVTTKAVSGTCTVTTKINTTALGGTANSASSSEQEQSHTTANAFSIGDDINVVISSNSSCTDLAITIEYERYVITAGLTDTRYGTQVITMGSSYADVTFSVAMSNANYVVAVEVPYQTSFWVTNKTTSGFRINVGTTPGYSETLGWSVRPVF